MSHPINMKFKSVLIDDIYGYEVQHEQINGEWYYAKPAMWIPLKRKIAWCIEILKGKAIAVHFGRDEV